MKYTVQQSANIVGISRQTIYRHIETKPISVVKDEEGNQFIEASELIRVYGEDLQFDNANSKKQKNKTSVLQDETVEKGNFTSDIEDRIKIIELETRLKALEEEKDRVNNERQRERAALNENIDYLKESLDKANEQQKRLTLLLTDQSEKLESRGGEEQARVEALEETVQELRKHNKIFVRKLQQQEAELKAEKDKGLFSKLFGS